MVMTLPASLATGILALICLSQLLLPVGHSRAAAEKGLDGGPPRQL